MCFLLFKQQTAYEMRISDWSSDVCSSDLELGLGRIGADRRHRRIGACLVATREHDMRAARGQYLRGFEADPGIGAGDEEAPPGLHADIFALGRASCRAIV